MLKLESEGGGGEWMPELEVLGGGGEWNVNIHAPPPTPTSNFSLASTTSLQLQSDEFVGHRDVRRQRERRLSVRAVDRQLP